MAYTDRLCGNWGIGDWGGSEENAFWGGVDSQDPLIWGLYPYCGTTNSPITSHIHASMSDPACTGISLDCSDIEITVNGVTTIIWQNGVFINGWTGTTTPYTHTVPGGTGVGYTMDATPPADFPNATEVCYTVTACDLEGNTSEAYCCFTTIGILSLDAELIRRDRVLVRFSNPLKTLSANPNATDLSNWSVRPVAGGRVHNINAGLAIEGVYFENAHNPTFAIVDFVAKDEWQRIEVAAKNFYDIYGATFGSGESSVTDRQTKVDSIMDGLPPFYEGSRVSRLFWVLSAIGISDEQLGGSQGLIQAEASIRDRV